jgi:3-oxoacyl-[acyl-carrier-protein] synthase II
MNGVVVTGMALWSPFGRGTRAFWDGLIAGQSGAKRMDRFDVEHKTYRSSHGAAIPGLGAEGSREFHDRSVAMLDAMVDDVLGDASLVSGAGDVSPFDVATILGTSLGPSERLRRFSEGGLGPDADEAGEAIDELSIVGLSARVARRVGARGPVSVVATACASGTSSIGLAYDLIRRGRARRAFAGGIGIVSELSFSGFNILRVLSKEDCRPFDVERSGIMLGDAVALVVLEDEALARNRGANVQAVVTGYASGNEAHHATHPDPTGRAALAVMWNALDRSVANLSRLDYINAHGTGTTANDAAELAAIDQLLAKRGDAAPVGVSSTKGHHGHALAAAGSVEFIATVLAVQNAMIPGTRGLREPEAGFERIDFVRDGGSARDIRLALSNSFAFGGNVASICVERAGTAQ